MPNRLPPASKVLPFEVHVTVRSPDIAAFREFCSGIGVKPIVLDLQDREGTSVLTDVMTSSKITGTDRDAYNHATTVATCLRIAGFEVVRQKIESVPWHPNAPKRGESRPMPSGSYFESHLAVTTTADRLDDLAAVAKATGCHRSRNVFKRDGNTLVVMLTRRVLDGSHEEFSADVDRIASEIRSAGFEVGKVEIEFAVWDSKVEHDKAWTSAA